MCEMRIGIKPTITSHVHMKSYIIPEILIYTNSTCHCLLIIVVYRPSKTAASSEVFAETSWRTEKRRWWW